MNEKSGDTEKYCRIIFCEYLENNEENNDINPGIP